MKPKKNKEPANGAGSKPTGDADSLATLRAECQRLRKQVQALEEQRERDQETMAKLENYRQFFISWAKKEFSEKKMAPIPPRSEWMPFLSVLEELEKQAGK